jgi:catechol 2,3-dioxygenase-like lactoylglutathione lyase family enzyme
VIEVIGGAGQWL